MQDVFKLKKSGWYVKLVKQIWNVDWEDFSHLCPLFWLALVSVPIWIIYQILRPLIMFGRFILKKFADSLYKENMKRTLKKKAITLRIINDIKEKPDLMRELARKRYEYQYEDGCTVKGWEDIYYFLDLKGRIALDNMVIKIHEERYAIFKEKELLKWRRQKMEEKARTARKATINNIVRWAKPIGKGILWILAAASGLVVIYFLYFLGLLISKISAQTWGLLGLVVLGGLLLFLIIYLLSRITLPEISISCKTYRKVTTLFDGFYKYIIYPFIWLFGGIVKIFVAFFNVIRNNCPAIEWTD